jgi:hypothetical protein
MYRIYVLAVSGTVVDFEHASLLMDQDLLQRTRNAMQHERDHEPRWDATYGPQWIWDYYCERHREKFGEGFIPDVTPGWDQPSTKPMEQHLQPESTP